MPPCSEVEPERLLWGRALGGAALLIGIGFAVGWTAAMTGWLPSQAYRDTPGTVAAIRGRLEIPPLETGWSILSNNLKVFAVYLAGAVALGLPSIVSLLWLGFQIGAFFLGGPLYAGTPPEIVWSVFLPHAVLEVPAFLLSGALGLRTLQSFLRYLGKGPFLTAADRRALLGGAGLAALLLVLAAVVEATLTPWCARAALAAAGY
ncbi:MAG: stage II sporulation protein M [Planctomycetes bacterium]|nr:stage II sporulation protein M [Planctomycetota bacterium]